MNKKLKYFFILLFYAVSLFSGCSHGHTDYGDIHDDDHKKPTAHLAKEKKDTHNDFKIKSNKDDDGHDHKNNIQKAVIKADKKKGIILRHDAVDSINLSVKKISLYRKGGNSYLIPNKALVFYEDKVCIYYKRDKWFNMSNASIIKTYSQFTLIYSTTINVNDYLVINGASLLRLAYLDAFGASGHGHVH